LVREHVQQLMLMLLEEEVTELLGWLKSARRVTVDAPAGVRNGYGKPRRLSRRVAWMFLHQYRSSVSISLLHANGRAGSDKAIFLLTRIS